MAEGAALDKPKQFNGTSVVVKTAASAKDVVYGTVKGGWEPHFVVVYGQVANELEKLNRQYAGRGSLQILRNRFQEQRRKNCKNRENTYFSCRCSQAALY